ncbi:MAG: DUF4252 domain-containing protein [Flavobacteriaceae bacterium]|nr:DUF4252 domain-containing protein [Flavobacteriaceae bacterium]
MVRIFKILVLLTFTLLNLSSCSSGASLEKYFVTSSEKDHFFSMDIPASMLKSDKISLEEEDKKILDSFKKINFLGFKKNNDNQLVFDKEIAQVKTILAGDSYEDLMKFNTKLFKGTVKIKGKEDKIDEVILFGYNQKQGFGIVRILGESMNPALLMRVIQKLEKEDVNEEGIKSLSNIFNI